MKRSRLKPGKGFDSPRKPMPRGAGLRRSLFQTPPAKPVRRKRLKVVGKKGREWAKVRRGLKLLFERTYGVTTCEARGKDCMIDNGLGFAHRYKRRFILTEAELKHVALLCNICHDFYELGTHKRMEREIDRIISERPNRSMEAA